MTERERWIVYPLLFLSLGAALRDKLFDMTTSKRIVCQELTVVDEDSGSRMSPRILAQIGRADQSKTGGPPVGYIVVNGQLRVAGAIDAQSYALRGAPVVPSWRARFSPSEFLRALQQSARAWQQSTQPRAQLPQSTPGNDALPSDETPAEDDATSSGPTQ